MGQTSFSDWQQRDLLSHLSDTDARIIRLVTEGITAAQAARLMQRSRAYVSRLLHTLEDLGLIRETSGRRYNRTYRPAPPLQEKILSLTEKEGPNIGITFCTPHNVRLKYRIILQEGEISRDKRAGFVKAYKPRGPERPLFWIPGRGDLGDVTVEVTPRSLIAFYSAHQDVVAESVEAAETLIRASIHEAVLRFIGLQGRHGCRIDIGGPAVAAQGSALPEALAAHQVTSTHYAFKASAQGPAATLRGARIGPFWVDGSPEAQGDPDHLEIETDQIKAATALDRGLQQISRAPDALEEITRKLGSIEAAVAGGTALTNKVDQLVNLLAAALLRQERLEAEILKLKEAQGRKAPTD